MRDQNPLFIDDDLDAQLRARERGVPEAVDTIPKDEFLASHLKHC